eukprot:scaffold217669_cov28-Tisochrysis_lutea.AAC.2
MSFTKLRPGPTPTPQSPESYLLLISKADDITDEQPTLKITRQGNGGNGEIGYLLPMTDD